MKLVITMTSDSDFDVELSVRDNITVGELFNLLEVTDPHNNDVHTMEYVISDITDDGDNEMTVLCEIYDDYRE